jgi:hypothetical protein
MTLTPWNFQGIAVMTVLHAATVSNLSSLVQAAVYDPRVIHRVLDSRRNRRSHIVADRVRLTHVSQADKAEALQPIKGASILR